MFSASANQLMLFTLENLDNSTTTRRTAKTRSISFTWLLAYGQFDTCMYMYFAEVSGLRVCNSCIHRLQKLVLTAGARSLTYDVSGTSVHLTWQSPLPPCDEDVIGYKVAYEDSRGLPGKESPVLNAKQCEYTFWGLESGREYTVNLTTIVQLDSNSSTTLSTTKRIGECLR